MRIYPPIWLVLCVGAMVAVHRLLPIAAVVPPSARSLGWVLVGFSIGVILYCRVLFFRHHTAIRPFQPSSALVRTGPYRLSRNPIYLSMILLASGVGVALGTLAPFLLIPIFAWVLATRFVQPEEAMLRARFGAEYEGYCAEVRRWLGRTGP